MTELPVRLLCATGCEDFDIDGLRLDVAYCLDLGFLEPSCAACANGIKPDFVLVGETLHGDYNRWMNDHACHSVTNYECYKGLYSSFNTGNMHEISYSLNRAVRQRAVDACTRASTC